MHHGKLSQPIAKGLRELRKRIDAHPIPASKLDETFNLATWNIRELGKRARKPASLHLIAEILNSFDLIAITELRDNLTDLQKVMALLGKYWRVLYSDFNTDAGGNRERMAYLYDTRMIEFTGLAAEADPPRKKVKGEYLPAITWWRSPFLASFRAGNFDFILITAHIRWGDGAAARIPPLELLAKWIDKRSKEKYVEDKDIILLGDFNIPDVEGPLFEAITSKGLQLPHALAGAHGSNLARDKRYDQILHAPTLAERFTDVGGVLDFYGSGHKALFPGVVMTKEEFTYQVSDHLPLWVQVDGDIGGQLLDQVLNRA